MNIVDATHRYERWMGKHTAVVKADLQSKHELMRKSPFTFLRATFYRWVELCPELCSETTRAPVVISVGDLHVENFGTWRDAEGRLIWGVNDFDEAYPLPYTNDLIRLATSVHLASKESHFRTRARDGCALLLEGYRNGLKAGGHPYVLDEEHPALREIALGDLRDPVDFWRKLRDMPKIQHPPSADAKRALSLLLPETDLDYTVVKRQAGAGSLGRQRFVAITDWHGGPIAREIKAALPSACTLVAPQHGLGSFSTDLIRNSNRVPDPFLQLHEGWVVRRLAPDCSKIELANMPKRRDEERLLHAMGFETANVHLRDASLAGKIRKDLDRRSGPWLHECAKRMGGAINDDVRAWRLATKRKK
jgi:Uncharacterized protein conserved in bacteria (DUF2252)